MKVITTNPVMINDLRMSGNDKFLSFDGTKLLDVQSFQDWMDSKHPNWVGATNSTLSNGKSLNKNVKGGYGNYGNSTKKARSVYGAEYDSQTGSVFGGLAQSAVQAVAQGPAQESAQGSASTTTQSQQLLATVSETAPDGTKQKGKLWDKTKGAWVKGSDWFTAHPQVKALGGNVLTKVFGGLFQGLIPADAPPSADSTLPTDNSTPPSGMSKGLKIGLIVGGVVLLGIIFYAVSKSSSKK